MAVRVVETDFGTKEATKKKITEIQKMKRKQIQWFAWKYWYKVYQYAVQECPVGTSASTGRPNYIGGSLRASIRVTRGRPTSSIFKSGPYGVSRRAHGDHGWTYTIQAGGGGVINPNYGREVDYAAAVHDGHMGKGGKFVPPNRFLDRAITRAEGDYRKMTQEMLAWFEKKWAEGGLRGVPPRGYYLPTKMQMGG